MDIREVIGYIVVGYFFILTPAVLFVLSWSTTFKEARKGKPRDIRVEKEEEYRKAA